MRRSPRGRHGGSGGRRSGVVRDSVALLDDGRVYLEKQLGDTLRQVGRQAERIRTLEQQMEAAHHQAEEERHVLMQQKHAAEAEAKRARKALEALSTFPGLDPGGGHGTSLGSHGGGDMATPGRGDAEAGTAATHASPSRGAGDVAHAAPGGTRAARVVRPVARSTASSILRRMEGMLEELTKAVPDGDAGEPGGSTGAGAGGSSVGGEGAAAPMAVADGHSPGVNHRVTGATSGAPSVAAARTFHTELPARYQHSSTAPSPAAVEAPHDDAAVPFDVSKYFSDSEEDDYPVTTSPRAGSSRGSDNSAAAAGALSAERLGGGVHPSWRSGK